MYSINRYIIISFFLSTSLFSFGQSNFFNKIGLGLETQLGVGVYSTPIITSIENPEIFQGTDTISNVTLGIDGRADFWALQSKNVGYAYFGEISRGWLQGQTHAFSAHGHHAFIRIRTIRIDGEFSHRNRSTIRSITQNGENYNYEDGIATYKNIDRYQVGITFGQPTGFRFGVAAFREYFVENELTATGAKISFAGEKVSLVFSGILDHPIFEVDNPPLQGAETSTSIFYNVMFRVPISFHKKSYAKLLSRW